MGRRVAFRRGEVYRREGRSVKRGSIPKGGVGFRWGKYTEGRGGV